MFKLGAKLIYHDMFKWTQFLRATIKTDLCFSLFVYIAFLCFCYDSVFILVNSSIGIVFNVLYILLVKKSIKEENKCIIIFIVIVRIVVFGLMIATFILLTKYSIDSFIIKYNGILYILIVMLIIFCTIIFECIS